VALTSRRRSSPVPERLAALREAIELAEGRLPAEDVAAARAVAEKADERLARGEHAVVVALCGGTGSGKSSLFNALVGSPLAEVGAVRPVTAEARAVAVGDAEAAAGVLDWLDVGRRHAREPDAGLPDGLVLLDLPDHDSIEVTHREVVDRLVARVDVLVWVVDPVKYAQRALHAGYLAALAHHAEIVLVVLNQVDRLDAGGRRTVVRDLESLLTREGLGAARVLVASAASGEGVDALRAVLAEEVRRRRAAAARITADVRTAADALAVRTGPPVGARLDPAPLVRALAETAGVQRRSAAEAAAHTERGRDATRPLLSRALVGLLRTILTPLRLLRGGLRRRPAAAGRQGQESPRSSDRGVTVAPVPVRHALLALADHSVGADVPQAWTALLRRTAQSVSQDLPHRVANALDSVRDPALRRRWWRPYALIWSFVEVVAAAGAVWLAILAVLNYLRLPDPGVPELGDGLPLPTALLLGGALLWLVLAVLRRWLVRAGAARTRRRTVARLNQVVAESAETHAIAPLRAELAAHDALAAALNRAAR